MTTRVGDVGAFVALDTGAVHETGRVLWARRADSARPRTPRRRVLGAPATAVLAAAVLGAAPLAAQTSPVPPVDSLVSAGVIAEAVARYADVLATDSFRGRTTPSAALDRTARYIADQFARVGLERLADLDNKTGGQWILRYPLPGSWRVDPAGTSIALLVLDSAGQAMLTEGRTRQEAWANVQNTMTSANTATFNRTAYFTMPRIPLQPLMVDGESWATVVVAGPPAFDSVAAQRLAEQVEGKSVLYVPPPELDSATEARAIAQLAAATGRGVLVVAPDDSALFAARWRAAQGRLPQVVEYTLQNALRPHGWVARVWPGVLAGALAAAKVDLSALRAARTPVTRTLSTLKVELRLEATPPDSTWPTAPNVLGWLEGRDTARSREFVMIMAHMDEVNPSSEIPDSMAARATSPLVAGKPSNTLGVASLLALAEAFSRPEARPRRSVLFLVTSGGATPEPLGASYALRSIHNDFKLMSSVHPLAVLINLDRLERAGGDTVVGEPADGDSVWVDGLREVERMPAVDWITTTHPELGLTVLDGGTAFARRSDHFGFARARRPMLYFHATPSPHASGSESADRSSGVGATGVGAARKVARATQIVRLVFHVVTAVVNTDQMPRLNEAGREHFATAVEHLP